MLLALNSYENRVYQVGIEGGAPMVAKFYRPHRWSSAAIQEEHDFSTQLADLEIPVVAPWRDAQGRSLHVHNGFEFALFPRRGGRAPELGTPDDRSWVGRFLGRIHAVGRTTVFQHRPTIDPEIMGAQAAEFLVNSNFVPATIVDRYRNVVSAAMERIRPRFAAAGRQGFVRLHGDCHLGNILWTDDGPHFVDFDDCCTGPAIQDLWMLLSGSREQMQTQLYDVLDGYSMFQEFDGAELALIEPLRTLRIIHYAAWVAKRWDDPAFPLAFTWFNTELYWQDHVAQLEEQLARLDEPPLYWD